MTGMASRSRALSRLSARTEGVRQAQQPRMNRLTHPVKPLAVGRRKVVDEVLLFIDGSFRSGKGRQGQDKVAKRLGYLVRWNLGPLSFQCLVAGPAGKALILRAGAATSVR